MTIERPWTLGGARSTRTALLVTLCSALTGLAGCLLILVASRDWTGVAVGLGGIAWMLCMAGLSISLFSSTWRRGYGHAVDASISHGRKVTLIPQIRTWPVALVVSDLGLIAIFVANAARPDNHRMFVSWRSQAVEALAPYLAAFLVFLLLYFVVMHKRGRRFGIGLSREGIFLWRGRGGRFIAWEWIKRVDVGTKPTAIVLEVVEPSDRERDPEENWLTRSGLFRKQSIELAGSTYAINPVGVYAALAFYHRHAKARGELGDPAALDRLALNRFPDINDEIRRAGKALPAGEAVD